MHGIAQHNYAMSSGLLCAAHQVRCKAALFFLRTPLYVCSFWLLTLRVLPVTQSLSCWIQLELLSQQDVILVF